MISPFVSKKTIFIILLFLFFIFNIHSKNIITVIGTGYVGLVSGSCLADLGNPVVCADIDSKKIKNLKNGIMPIYEEGLDEIVTRNIEAGRLTFTDNIDEAINSADIIFIAVGTPAGDGGQVDLSYVDSVVKKIAQNINSFKIIVTKSTVPVGTGKKIRAQLEHIYNINPNLFCIASNPEFLREGFAVYDFLHPDRLVIGTESDSALIALCEIYEPLITTGTNYVLTDIQTAEMIKYASNGFLSLKISYINEIANVCDKVGANVAEVAFAMGLDPRINPFYLNPGPGFGGSCFPKDSQALIHIAQQHGLPFYTVQAALDANKVQQTIPVKKLIALLKEHFQQELSGKTIAILGLAFKANTDDVRYSPAITTIELLLKNNANVRVYDPIAMPNMRYIFPDITYCNSLYETVKNTDALIIITDWDEFKQMDFSRVKQLMNQPVIIDARNIVHPEILKQLGFVCDTIGLSYLCKKHEYIRKLVPISLRKRKPFTKFE